MINVCESNTYLYIGKRGREDEQSCSYDRQQQRHYSSRRQKGTRDYCRADALYIDGKLYYEDIDLTQEDFYRMLEKGGDISHAHAGCGGSD